MSWNNGFERKKFEEKWVRESAKYRELGMSEADIAVIRSIEEDEYRSERRYRMHTQSFSLSDFGEDEEEEVDDKSVLFQKFMESITVIEEYRDSSRLGWINEIETNSLVAKLQGLSNEDLELLTKIVFDGLTQQEVAEMLGISQQSISKKLKRIKKLLK